MKRFLAILLILVCIALVPTVRFLALARREKNVSADVSSGRAVLQRLAGLSVNDVQASMEERERAAQNALAQQERKAAVEETIQKIKKGELTYRKVLSKLYIAGDSLMEGLSVYNILNPKHIVSQVSASLAHLEQNFDKIVGMQPPILLLHYGLNMIDSNEAQQQRYIERYTALVERFKEALPNTRIVISLLFPVDTSVATAPRFKCIGQYNKLLKQMCEKEEIEYLDSASVFSGHNFYGADGIHLSGTFYRDYWLPHVIRELEISV